MQCQGECKKEGACAGKVKKVFVSGQGWVTPFEFHYCETAIDEDIRRGFLVLTEEDIEMLSDVK